LFLDEIGEMPLPLQVKLLRVLEDGSILPLGGTAEKRVDVRILAATNVDIQVKISAGKFREDLYFRLAAFIVTIPPLRERPGDIPLLANHFLKLFATEMAIETPALSDEALSTLTAYAFPGNVRELKNIIERALIESGGGDIHPEHLHFTQLRGATVPPPADSVEVNHAAKSLPLNLQQAEALLIQRALEQTNGNISEAARLLGIGRQTLYRKLS
jgi:transcriptional regulator with PAS, ATPase and Fis domain